MKPAEYITFESTCDRDCSKTKKHHHKASEPSLIQLGKATPQTKRQRFPYAELEGWFGSRFSMCLTVQDLITRLQQLPPSAIISMESESGPCDLMAFDPSQNDKLWTILNNFEPENEDFNFMNQVLK